ncbi:hypothetical protein [Barnesiella intestinihominis]|uniref:hypothetical protein n=1 Tax=Barnesiella intestinihominis TaxID=487174 RepID=UPI003A88E633
MILSAPSPFGHSPYLICDEQRERIESITLSRFIPSELCGVFSSSPAVSRSITGCFAQQNIEEVARSDGRVK